MLLWPFNKYPGTDYETFNWEWVLKTVKDYTKKVDDFTENITNAWDTFRNYINHEIAEMHRKFAIYVNVTEEALNTGAIANGAITKSKIDPDFLLEIENAYVTPEMFGAAGDGLTDDTTAIQNCLNSDVKYVILKNRYLVSNTLTYDSYTNINGLNSGEIIVSDNFTSSDVIVLEPVNDAVHDVIIRDVFIDQNSNTHEYNGTSPCISVNSVENVTIENVTFNNVITMGVWADDRTGSTKNVKIKNCFVKKSEAGGFSLFGNIENAEIVGNIITNTKDDAIALQAVNNENAEPVNCIVTNNIVKDCDVQGGNGSTPHGILCLGVKTLVITGNEITNTYAAGIRVYTGTKSDSDFDLDTLIAENVIKNAGSNNTGTATAANGISCAGSSATTAHNVQINNNLIDSPKDAGVVVNYIENGIIEGNNVNNSGAPGVAVSNSETVKIADNKLYKTGSTSVNSCAILLDNNTDCDINENHTSGGGNNYGITITATNADLLIKWNVFKDCTQNNTIENYSSQNIKFIGNVYKNGNPFKKKVTLASGVYYTDITGLNGTLTGKGSIIVTPKNVAAGTLLKQGYDVTEINNGVNLHTHAAASGTEEIEISII